MLKKRRGEGTKRLIFFFGGGAIICIQIKLIVMLCGHRLRKELKDDQSFTVLKNELHMDFFKAIKGSQFRYRYMCRKSEVILA